MKRKLLRLSLFIMAVLSLMYVFGIKFSLNRSEVHVFNATKDMYIRQFFQTSDLKITEISHKVWTNEEMTDFILGKKNGRGFRENATNEYLNQFRPQFFGYLINNEEICQSAAHLTTVLCIYSAPNHFEDRKMIRMTWGKSWNYESYKSTTVFLLGAVTDDKLQKRILNESRHYKDIIQTNYIDSYHNVSYKGIAMLQWVKDYCNNTKYVIKADDDLYVDIFKIMKVIPLISSVPRFIAGKPVINAVVIRKTWQFRKEWTVEENQLPGQKRYPQYYAGWIYMFSTSVIRDFHHIAMTTPVFKIDDVYMTGLLAGQLHNLTHFGIEGILRKGHFLPTRKKLAKDECDGKCKLDTWCKHLEKMDKQDKEWIGQDLIIQEGITCKMLQNNA